MDPATLRAIAEILHAGAERSRQWVYNPDRQQEAEVLEAMAERANELADEAEQTGGVQ
jgi:ferredoxin-thioredoxin reductase catalytic subunit